MDELRRTKTYIHDIERCISFIENIDCLKNKSVFVTGCNGLICSTVIDTLILLNNRYDLGITVYSASRNTERTMAIFDTDANKFIKIIGYDACKPMSFGEHVDFYIHGASNASPDLFVSQPVETMTANVFGLNEILSNATKTRGRVLYISSSEIYGQIATNRSIMEDELGYIDLGNPRSCYASSKRAAETLCSAYKKEFGVDYVIVRPGHIYGPTFNEKDNRVSSNFIKKAASGENLVLRSRGTQVRSYCYVFDCVIQLLNILLNGDSGEAYNISNPKSLITIADMAKILASITGVQCFFELRADEQDNPMQNSSLSSRKFEALMENKTNTFIQNAWKGNGGGVFKQGRGICPMCPHLTGAYA